MEKLKIAVLFGGNSSERTISIASGIQVVKALKQRGHEVLAADTTFGILDEFDLNFLLETDTIPLFLSQEYSKDNKNPSLLEIISCLVKADLDVVFLVLHGGMGEDGTIQAILDLANLPYTGSGLLGSAIAMDKDIAKRILLAAGIPTPDWIMAPADQILVSEKLGFPVVVKPNKQGSTIGLSLVSNPNNLEEAINLALRYDNEVIIEKFIDGRELTVGILANKALTVGEIIPLHSKIYDYASKYEKNGAEIVFPAKITSEQEKKICDFAITAHNLLKIKDYSRADFRMDNQGNIWFLEIETLPGMRIKSLLPQSAAASGMNFAQLCEKIAFLAVNRNRSINQILELAEYK